MTEATEPVAASEAPAAPLYSTISLAGLVYDAVCQVMEGLHGVQGDGVELASRTLVVEVDATVVYSNGRDGEPGGLVTAGDDEEGLAARSRVKVSVPVIVPAWVADPASPPESGSATTSPSEPSRPSAPPAA